MILGSDEYSLCSLGCSGGVYLLGQLGREDRGVLVRRAPKLAADDLETTLSAFLSENGTVSTFHDGYCRRGRSCRRVRAD